jgi:F420H(2)-dependent quinone reductase
MPLNGEYEPSPTQWVRDQVELYESSAGTAGAEMRGMPVVIVTMRGRRSDKLRKVPLMRVGHDGAYALVASIGGAPNNPVWYSNLLADPHVELQDGATKQDMVVREITGDEKAVWWERCVAAFPNYADYAAKARMDREIPVLLAESS